MKRWCGETSASAVDEPAEPIVELCQSTTYAMIHGQKPAGEPDEARTAEAVSEMRPITRSAMGLRSWSCGGDVV